MEKLTNTARNSGAEAAPGTIVRTTGNATVALAQSDSAANAQAVIGVTVSAAPVKTGGALQYAPVGEVEVLLETGLTPVAGDLLYLSATVAGRATIGPAEQYGVAIGAITDASIYAATGRVRAELAIFSAVNSSGDADWALTKVRYFVVDYVNGDDTNIGFVDADAGTVFVASDLQAIAVKTIEEIQSRTPRQGAGRSAVVLIAGNPDGATQIEYFRKDGTTRDWIDRNGYSGYGTLIWRASDLTNSADDRRRCACQNAATGPNADGSFTVQSYSAPIITNAAGTMSTTIDDLAGCSIDFKGNVTTALATKGGVVKEVLTATTVEVGVGGLSLITNPAAGDEYFIRRPSVLLRELIGACNNVVPNSQNSTLELHGTVFGGFDFFVDDVGVTVSRRMVFNRISIVRSRFGNITTTRITAGSGCCLGAWYFDEVANVVECGSSMTFKPRQDLADTNVNLSMEVSESGQNGQVFPVCGFVVTRRGATSSNVLVNLSSRHPAAASAFSRSAVFGAVIVNGPMVVRSSSILGTSSFGFVNATFGGNINAADRLIIRGSNVANVVGLTIGGGVVGGLKWIDIGGFAANAIVVMGVGNCVVLQEISQGPDANTGYGLDMSSYVGGPNFVSIGPNMTVTGSLGDILLDVGVIKTWADVTQGFLNSRGCMLNLTNQTVGPLRKITADTIGNAPVVSADPASPANGDIWIKDTGGVRTLNVRIAGATYSTTLT